MALLSRQDKSLRKPKIGRLGLIFRLHIPSQIPHGVLDWIGLQWGLSHEFDYCGSVVVERSEPMNMYMAGTTKRVKRVPMDNPEKITIPMA